MSSAVFGRMRLDDLNVLPDEEAVSAFVRCCGSTRWARGMAAARPFADIEAAEAAADKIWSALTPADWREAFGAHPRIGERQAAAAWSEQEQAGARGVSEAIRERLAARNRDYEARFGYIFIVCATGKGAGEMLANLERRLAHGPDDELRVAAEEQRKITRLRIARLLDISSERGRGPAK